MSARTCAALAAVLLATAGTAAGQTLSDEGTRLVIVTFERRVASALDTRPGQYPDSLARWREAVVERLFGPEEGAGLLRPGDAVALFADGQDADFPGHVALDASADAPRVDRALLPMLSLPGSPTGAALWLRVVDGPRAAVRGEVDAAIRELVTCPLVGAPPGPCPDERGGEGPGQDTRGFSRPQLTLPVQYRLAAQALRARGRDLPDAVYWIWVQSGERVNEINSLAPEIVRDFGRAATGTAVGRFYGQAVASLGVRPLVLPPDARAVGVTVWKVTSAELERLMVNPAATLPVTLEVRERDGWRRGEPRSVATSLFRTAPPLADASPLRVSIAPVTGADGARLLRVQGSARCLGATDTTPVALAFGVTADGATAVLGDSGRAALRETARHCLPAQGVAARLGREVTRRRDAVRLELVVRAQVAAAGRTGALPAPPALATLGLTREWAYEPLRAAELVALAVLALCVGVALRRAWRAYLFLRSPTRMGFELLTPQGETITAETVVPLVVPDPGAPARLRLQVVRRDGPRARGNLAVEVVGRGLQSDVPVASTAEAAHLIQAVPAEGASTSVALGAQAAEVLVELRIPPGVVDLDRVAVDTPLRAGVEVHVRGVPDRRGVLAEPRTFYVPCSITVGRSVSLRGPRVLLRPFQRYLYRGLRTDPTRRGDGRPVVLGLARVLHRADPGTTALPYPVRLTLSIHAVVRWDDGHEAVMRAALGTGGGAPPVPSLELDVDDPKRDLTAYLWPYEAKAPPGASGLVHVAVQGQWHEVRPGAAPPRPLATAREQFALYQAAEVHGIALDFGTSATRLAFLADGDPAGNVAAIPLPERLVPPPPRDRPPVAELESEVAIGPNGQLLAAGAGAHLAAVEDEDAAGAQEQVEVLPSLKLALMDRPGDERVWAAARTVIDRLGEVVERPRRDGNGLPVMRWAGGVWHPFPVPLAKDFRYLLLVTVPDTFTQDDQRRLVACFENWQGRVDVLPLREAEAVVYGFLRRYEDRRPGRTLVVDVGAGTVDYAAVRAEFHQEQMLEVRVEGLSVSRAAGNAYDLAVGRFTGMAQGTDEEVMRDRSLLRRLRETKEQQYAEHEAVGHEPGAAAESFLASHQARAYFDAALRTPLRALLGRLAFQAGWDPAGFDQVILSGRGSLAAGWKRTLVAELRAARLVPGEQEREWLYWLGPAPEGDAGARLRHRAGRLKAAVAEGALALVTYEQTRVQTSRDILRDHLVLVTQDALGKFSATLLFPAGEVIPGEGLWVDELVGDWIEARLLLSSHPPAGAGVTAAAVSASELWRAIPAAGVEAFSIPIVRTASSVISIQDCPQGADRIRVSVTRGGTVRWSWASNAREAA